MFHYVYSSLIARSWKESRYPSAEEWLEKMYIYTMEYYSDIKNNKCMKFEANGWIENILSEVNQSKRTHMLYTH